MLQIQVLPEFNAGFKHPNALTVSQQERVTVSQSEPIAGVVSNDRADVLMSDLGMVNTLVKNNPDQFDRGFMIITNFKIAVGYTKDNKDLGQALLDALTILRSDGTEKKLFEKYGVDYAISQPSQILTK